MVLFSSVLVIVPILRVLSTGSGSEKNLLISIAVMLSGYEQSLKIKFYDNFEKFKSLKTFLAILLSSQIL